MRRSAFFVLLFGVLICQMHTAHAFDGSSKHCDKTGVWVQILGAGAGELDNDQAGTSYLVWLDNKARLLVNAGSGAASQFAKTGASFLDLDAIAFNDLTAARTGALPFFVSASVGLGRDRPLTLLGPDGNDNYPDTKAFLERLIGPNGAFAHLSDFLTYKSSGGYKLSARDVPATGQRRWARFGSQHFRLSAIPVSNGGTPSVAWRVAIGGYSVVFSGAFSNEKDVLAKFAKGADALVVPHAVPETVRGTLRDRYAVPSKLGDVAQRAEARMLILGHRNNRTRGRESQTEEAIRKHYDGPLIFGNDLECWGL